MSRATPSACIAFAATGLPDQPGLQRAFGPPVQLLQAHALDEVRGVIEAAEAASLAGHWCVGFVAYEAAAAFDAALLTHPPRPDLPLAWFAVYRTAASPEDFDTGQPDAVQATWDDGHDRARFDADLASLRQAIADGEVYQVNHTALLRGTLKAGMAWDLWAALRREQPGGFGAWIDGGDWQVLSASPELFFDWNRHQLLMRPMKGTAPRGADAASDAMAAEGLRASAKERAENVMIVDLVRHDVSRVAEPHSVRVPRLFHLEPLPTVWQMTSDVQATTRAGTGLWEVMQALFPCGSVTGAPKVRAMHHIRQREPDARDVYCGAVGVLRPGGGATFNVAIRTVLARSTPAGAALQAGVGSGITWDARSAGEWREWQHKRAFIERASAPFELLETLALQDGMLRHRERHLARLQRTAAHFGFVWQPADVQACLDALAAAHPQGLQRVRLTLDRQGRPQATAVAMPDTPGEVLLTLDDRPLPEAHSEFVRFKTTRRAHYDAAAARHAGAFDVLLWNADGELTECTRANIALFIDGQWLTPAAVSGLLPGIGREQWLEEGRLREATLTLADLDRASAVACFNSLRGWMPARLQRPGGTRMVGLASGSRSG